jgi:hypothetical protein
MTGSNPLYPLIEVIKRPNDPAPDRPWEFDNLSEGETPHTDIANRRMAVPTDDSKESFGIRTHEMLHAQLSPYATADMDMATLAAEDGRIETLATNQGIKRPAGLRHNNIMASLLKAGDMDTAYLAAAATTGAPGETNERKALDTLVKSTPAYAPYAKALTDFMDWSRQAYTDDPTFESTRRVEGRLRELVTSMPSPPKDGKGKPGDKPQDGKPQDGDGKPQDGDSKPGDGKPGDGKPGDGSSQDGKPGDGKSSPSRPRGAPPISGKPRDSGTPKSARDFERMMGHVAPSTTPIPKAVKSGESSKPDSVKDDKDTGVPDQTIKVHMPDVMSDMVSEDGLKWATPEIRTPARPLRILGKREGRKRSKMTDSGSIPTRMSRLTVDGKVFPGKKHRPQGTILIDMSGSMSVNPDAVRELITKAPATVVAGYWTSEDNGKGRIKILAAGGRMVDTGDMYADDGGMNGCDGPAIAWLARQRAPRIWICDGGITAMRDEVYAYYHDESPVYQDSAMGEQFWNLVRQARIKWVKDNEIDVDRVLPYLK